MSSSNYAGNLGKRNLVIYILIDLKRKMKEDIVFAMKEDTHILNANLKQTHYRFPKPFNFYIQFKKLDLERLNKLVSVQSQVKALRLQDKLGKQNFTEVYGKSI